MKKTIIVITVALIASCGYEASFEDCTIQCTADTGCPDGLTCGPEGLCRVSGATKTCAAVIDSFPSCDGLPATCGPTASGDCCETASIPGGTFLRSYDEAPDGMHADASFPATVSAFTLDKYEVTVGRFRAFIAVGTSTQQSPPASGAGAHARIPGSGWDTAWNVELATDAAALHATLECDTAYQTWTSAPAANDDLPINCVTWYEAMAFCIWDGGYLPTEAEWNFAAAGGDEQRAYPWSNPTTSLDVDCSHANYNPGPFCIGTGGVNRVGSESFKGDGRFGQADLGGNINEWMLDGYAVYQIQCDDCATLTDSGGRVVRGSDWANAADTLRTAFRNFTMPTVRDSKVGFRCARP